MTMLPFIDPFWQESLISLLVAINGLAGAPERTAAIRPLTSSDVVAIAQSLEQRAYRPEQWFSAGGTAALPAVRTQAPPVSTAARYEVIWLAAEPGGLTQMSSRAGGLLYEDPFYAVLASYNIGLRPARPQEGRLVEVKVSSRERAWAQRQQIVDDLRKGSYRADNYFRLSGPALPPVAGATWRSDGLAGSDLERLVFSGQAAAAFGETPPALYGLYAYVAP
jgi:hypothetical protein